MGGMRDIGEKFWFFEGPVLIETTRVPGYSRESGPYTHGGFTVRADGGSGPGVTVVARNGWGDEKGSDLPLGVHTPEAVTRALAMAAALWGPTT